MPLPKGLTARRSAGGLLIMRTHYSADPDRDPETNPAWYKRERSKYTSEGDWQREQEIIHDAGGGERLFVETLVKHWSKIVIEDSDFEVPPQWKRIGGADHGKANPTAFLEAAIDYDGNIYLCAEYYRPGLSPDQHLDLLWEEWPELFDIPEIYADPSIFYKTQAQAKGGFKAISELYAEERELEQGMRPGLQNLISAPDNAEILGMERILQHWHDLEHREPSLRIVCPRRYDTSKKRYGLYRDGCPNLIWELRRARREELSATQLESKNPSEKIVDKDNHLRDCLKYIVLSLPDPTIKSREERAADSVRGLDATSAMIRYRQFMEREVYADKPLALGRRALMQARRRR